MSQTIILCIDMNVQLCTKFCNLKKPGFSYIKLLRPGSNSKKKVIIQMLERNFQNHFNHSFDTFEHVSHQNWIYEQNDFNLDQCALHRDLLLRGWQNLQMNEKLTEMIENLLMHPCNHALYANDFWPVSNVVVAFWKDLIDFAKKWNYWELKIQNPYIFQLFIW